MNLPEPMEFIDLHPGHSMTLRIDSYTDGVSTIHPVNPSNRHIAIHMKQNGLTQAPPLGTPIGVEIPVLRLFGERQDQFSPVHYFDVSSKTLRADLLARMAAGIATPFTVTLTATEPKPRKRYSVEIV